MVDTNPQNQITLRQIHRDALADARGAFQAQKMRASRCHLAVQGHQNNHTKPFLKSMNCSIHLDALADAGEALHVGVAGLLRRVLVAAQAIALPLLPRIDLREQPT